MIIGQYEEEKNVLRLLRLFDKETISLQVVYLIIYPEGEDLSLGVEDYNVRLSDCHGCGRLVSQIGHPSSTEAGFYKKKKFDFISNTTQPIYHR